MLSSEDIAKLKTQYGEVFEISVNKTLSVIFRALTFAEFDNLAITEDYISAVDSEDNIVKKVLLHPDFSELENLGAGVLSTICEEIIEESAFFNVSKAMEKLGQARSKKEDVRFIMKAFVISAIPAYKPEDLDGMTFLELSNKVALAEQIIELKVAMQQSAFAEGAEPPTLVLIDEEAEAAEQERRKAMHNLTRKEGAAVADDPIARKLHQSLG
jgi:hypothetical protein